MTTAKVLVEGYAHEWRASGWQASSSVTFVDTGKLKIICDPGINTDLLFAALKENSLNPDSIDWVFLSHTALEYAYGVALFPKAKIIVDRSWHDKESLDLHSGEIPGTNLKILKTPGHAIGHTSLVVPTEEGIYVVAGGAFWWAEDEEQKTDKWSLINHKDVTAVSERMAKESRKKILEIADFVIPGFGKTFEVK